MRLAQVVVRSRQQHRDRSGFFERRKFVLAGVLEMIGGERPKTGRDRRAASGQKLIGVDFHRQPERLRAFEKLRSLFRREGDRLAKRVDGVGEILGDDGRQDLVADEVDVIVGVRPLGTERMQSQVRRAHAKRVAIRQRARGA